MLDRQIPEM